MKNNFASLCPPGTKVIYYPRMRENEPEVHIIKGKPSMMGVIETVEISDGRYTSTAVLVSNTGWKGALTPAVVNLDLLKEEQIDWLE